MTDWLWSTEWRIVRVVVHTLSLFLSQSDFVIKCDDEEDDGIERLGWMEIVCRPREMGELEKSTD